MDVRSVSDSATVIARTIHSPVASFDRYNRRHGILSLVHKYHIRIIK